MADNSSVNSRRKQYLNRWETLKQEREPWMNHYRELAKVLMPRAGRFLTSEKDRNQGKYKHNRIINETGLLAVRDSAAGIQSGLTSRARPWFKAGISDTDLANYRPVKEWLETVTTLMRDFINRSNFYTAISSIYPEFLTFGTMGMTSVEDLGNSSARFHPYTVGEYCIAQNDKLEINTLYREVPMTVEGVVRRFGLDAVSQPVKNFFNKSQMDVAVDVLHVVEENNEQEAGYGDFRGMAWRSTYMEVAGDSDKLLKEEGFETKPVQLGRWRVLSGNIYGDSPAMDALGGTMSQQSMEAKQARAIDKMLDPPLQADANLRQEPISMVSGDITYVQNLGNSAGAKITPIVDLRNAPIGAMEEKIGQITERINSALYVDLFRMLSTMDRKAQMTVREVVERHSEKVAMLDPMLSRVHDEFLDGNIERIFAMMFKNGWLPPPPREIQGQDLQIEYISILAQAQKAVATGSMESVVDFVGRVSVFKPGVLDILNGDELVREYASAVGVSTKVINEPSVVTAMRKQQAEQAQLQQAAELAKPMKDGAEAVQTLQQVGADA